MKIYKLSFVIGMALMVSCSPPSWQPTGSIFLNDITPIGLGILDDQIWLSDGDNNRVMVLDMSGEVLRTYDEVERPMHLDISEGTAYVPSYGSDDVLMIKGDNIDTLSVDVEFEAPAAVSVSGSHTAIADFYNNRIAISDGTTWKSVGKKGKGPGEYSYPTDVQVFGDKIYVADAYNNRIQVLDIEGKHLQTIGEDQQMNAATGIYTDGTEIYITDFEHDRVLIFDMEGKVTQIIDQGLNKPTDVLLDNGKMYVTNYKGKYISIYEKS